MMGSAAYPLVSFCLNPYVCQCRSPTGVPSADAAARLAAVEITSQQQAAQLTTMARQLDKLQAKERKKKTE